MAGITKANHPDIQAAAARLVEFNSRFATAPIPNVLKWIGGGSGVRVMSIVPAGGPSTVNGVVYQLLWSLITLGGFRVADSRLISGGLSDVTLILEPVGGDQQSVSSGHRVVTQLKSRSGGGAWSLQEVVRDVLPDLFLGVTPDVPAEYQFVTEGRLGKWEQVEVFFRNLPTLPVASEPLMQLADTGEVNFGRGKPSCGTEVEPFWEPGPYTPRKLIHKIVETIRKKHQSRKRVAEEPYEVTCRKVWELLRGFRFIGGQSHEEVRCVVDRWLLGLVGSADRLAETRDHLLLDLARRCCVGNAKVTATEFFAAHGLDGTPLTNWFALSRQASNYLTGMLRRKRVDLSTDARPTLTSDLMTGWTAETPILVLTGESGSGKTWHGYQLLAAANENGEVAILVDARRDADKDLDEVAKTFWHEIASKDESPPLGRLRARLRQVDRHNSNRRLTVLFDNVSDPEEARRLIEADWEGWGARVVMTCTSQVADAIGMCLGGRGRVAAIPDFTLEELRCYLSDAVGVDWNEIPFDVRKTLRRPLLAWLFRDVVPSEGWKPRNEYELYEQTWDRLRHRGAHAFDLDAVRPLARGLLEGVSYPWTPETLRAGGLSAEGLDRLLSAGWLRETTGGGYEVWHDRMLNWAVAEAVVHELRHHPEQVDAQCDRVAALLRDPRAKCGRWFAYVPMDILWLLSDPRHPETELFRRFLARCDGVLGWRASETLQKELLPTLGERGFPFFLERLRAVAETGPSYEVNNILDGLVASGSEKLTAGTFELIADPSAKVRRAGVRLFARRPTPEALPLVWDIHAAGTRDPAPYSWEHEKSWSLYDDTFRALKNAIRLATGWLEQAIQNADPNREPVHDLAYLVARTGDPALWRRCKPFLKRKVDEKHERSLANCVQVFRDTSEAEWLLPRVTRQDDALGPAALRALASIDPERALAALDALPERELLLTRGWCFGELLRRLPDQVLAHFASRLRSHSDPWRYAQVLQGREDLIDPDTFDLLLDRLGEQLAATVRTESPGDILASCRGGISFVNNVCRPALLERLRLRREAPLESHLTDWLLALGPQSGVYREYDKHEGLAVLAKIGGEGLSRVLDDWLDRGDWYAQMHAVQLAQRRVTSRTIELLSALSAEANDGEDDRRGMVSGYAAAALAVHRSWEPVLGYYLRVGLESLNMVDECCPAPEPPLGDDLLAEVLLAIRSDGSSTPGAVLAIGLSERRDLLPLVRTALCRADPTAATAGAALLALKWLGDTEPDTVPAIVRCLPHHDFHATNALLTNTSPDAHAVLLDRLGRKPDAHITAVLANTTAHRETVFEIIRKQVTSGNSFGWGGLRLVVNRLRPDVLRAFATLPEVFAYAEETAYGPYGGFCVVGERPTALQIVGQQQPDSASRTAFARLCDPRTPDAELYVPLLARFVPSQAVDLLLKVVLTDPPSRIVRAVALELRRLDSISPVLSWLSGTSSEHRLAACRVVGFLAASPELCSAVRACADDPDHRIASEAAEAIEQWQRDCVVSELTETFANEADETHRWVLLDALIAVADPGVGDQSPSWIANIREQLSPAMAKYLGKKLEERRKKVKDDLDRADRRRS